MSLYLPKTVKDRSETFIRQNNPKIEHGGYFIGTGNTLLIPRFYPNMSDHPHTTYEIEPAFPLYLRFDMSLFGMDLAVNFHTHPNHSITSENDLKYSKQQTIARQNIMIGYNSVEDKFTWHAYENSGLEIALLVVNTDYPIFKEVFSRSLHLIPLGDCFLTPQGELLANNPFAKAALEVDTQAIRVHDYFMHKQHVRKSRTQVATELGLTVPALVKIITKLQARGVRGLEIPNNRRV